MLSLCGARNLWHTLSQLTRAVSSGRGVGERSAVETARMARSISKRDRAKHLKIGGDNVTGEAPGQSRPVQTRIERELRRSHPRRRHRASLTHALTAYFRSRDGVKLTRVKLIWKPAHAADLRLVTPNSARTSATLARKPRMWLSSIRPIQPMRKLSATVNLPG
jgi:hypothetical protein